MNKILNKSIYNAAIVIVSAAGRLLLLSMLARYLTKIDYGTFSLWLWYSEMIVIIFGVGIAGEFVRYLSTINIDKIKSYVLNRMFFLIISSVFFIIIYSISNSLFDWYIYKSNHLYFVLGLYFFTQIFIETVKAYFRGRELYKTLLIIEFCFVFVNFVVIYYLIKTYQFEAVFWVLASTNVFGIIIIGVLIMFSLSIEKMQSSILLPESKAMAKYRFYIWINALVSFIVWGRTEFYFLQGLGKETVAVYAVAITITGLIYQVSNMFLGVLIPHFSGVGVGKREEYLNIFKMFSLFLIFISTLGLYLLPIIINVMFGSSYSESVIYVNILMFGTASLISGVTCSYLLALSKSKQVLLINLSGGTLLFIILAILEDFESARFFAVAKVFSQWFIAILLILYAASLSTKTFNKSPDISFFYKLFIVYSLLYSIYFLPFGVFERLFLYAITIVLIAVLGREKIRKNMTHLKIKRLNSE